MASQEATPSNPVPSKRWTQFYAALQLAIQRAARKWTFVLFLFFCFLSLRKLNLSFIQIQGFFRVFPSLVRGAAQRRRRRLQYRIELYRNAHRRTAFLLLFSIPSLPNPTVVIHFLRGGVVGSNKNNTNKLFEEYDVQQNLDTLHQVVTEARERRQRGEPGASAAGAGAAGGSGSGQKDLWRADLQPRAAVRAQTVPTLERERDALRARLADVRSFFSPFISEFFPSLPCFPRRFPTREP